MTKFIFDKNHNLVEKAEAIPVCSEDFCDKCGDCLHCYWESPCLDNNEHFWVEYKNE